MNTPETNLKFNGLTVEELTEVFENAYSSSEKFRSIVDRQQDGYIAVARAVALGKKGGKVTSNAKAKAVRANGKLGGRPKKQAQQAKTEGAGK